MQRTGRLMVKYVGSTPLGSLNPGFFTTVERVSNSIEADYPKVTEAKIQGSKPHKSHKDPSDKMDVITVSYHTDKGTRIVTVHAHEDGTWKEFPSRSANKGK